MKHGSPKKPKQKVIVKINDRGPFHDDRLIDLSYGAAVKLDIARKGTGRVEVRVIDGSEPSADQTPEAEAQPPESTGKTYVQVGAFKYFVNAQDMRARAAGAGLLDVSVDKDDRAAGGTIYRVRVGPYRDHQQVDATLAKLRDAGIIDYKLIAE